MVSLGAFKTWTMQCVRIENIHVEVFSWVVKRGQNYVYAVIECLLSMHFINVSVECKHKGEQDSQIWMPECDSFSRFSR